MERHRLKAWSAPVELFGGVESLSSAGNNHRMFIRAGLLLSDGALNFERAEALSRVEVA